MTLYLPWSSCNKKRKMVLIHHLHAILSGQETLTGIGLITKKQHKCNSIWWFLISRLNFTALLFLLVVFMDGNNSMIRLHEIWMKAFLISTFSWHLSIVIFTEISVTTMWQKLFKWHFETYLFRRSKLFFIVTLMFSIAKHGSISVKEVPDCEIKYFLTSLSISSSK